MKPIDDFTSEVTPEQAQSLNDRIRAEQDSPGMDDLNPLLSRVLARQAQRTTINEGMIEDLWAVRDEAVIRRALGRLMQERCNN